MDIKDILLIVAKKIERVEDKDPNFRESKKWIKLREQQNILMKENAREKLEYYERLNHLFPHEKYSVKMEECKKYLEEQK